MLVDAMRKGIVNDLLASGDSSLTQLLTKRLAKNLSANTGIPSDLARWVMESWAFALESATEREPESITTTKYIVVRVNIKPQRDANPVDVCHQLQFTYDARMPLSSLPKYCGSADRLQWPGNRDRSLGCVESQG